MKKILAFSALFVAVTGSPAMAANLAVITSPPTLLNFLVFCIAIGCIVGSVKVMGLVKGGHFFKSWQIFLLGFAGLALAQLAGLIKDFEIVSLPAFLVPILVVVASGLLLYGIFSTIRILE